MIRFQIIYELTERSLKLAGLSFRISWGKEPRSLHTGLKKYFEVKKAVQEYRRAHV